MRTYLNRLFDDIIEFSLKSCGAILVVGPKWCGKTRTCRRYAKEVIDLLDIEKQEQYITFAKNAPSKFLKSYEKPLLIDEWQIISFIWNAIKKEVDDSGDFGQFILTGSVTDRTTFNDLENKEIHTGNGRIVKKMMRTFSLFESNESSGEISLSDLLQNKKIYAVSKAKIEDYAFYICRGGWPLSLVSDKDIALAQAENYYRTLYEEDIFSLKDIKIDRNLTFSEKFFRSYARNVGTSANESTLINDIGCHQETFKKLYSAASRLYVLDELAAWNPNLRSKAAIRTKNTMYFVDPSIAAKAKGLNPDSLFMDMKFFGFLFESLAIRDLRIYCESIGAKLYHYRDSYDRECDAVIVFKNGEFGLVEIKLGDEEVIQKAFKTLDAISKDLTNKPKFKMVITKGEFGYNVDEDKYIVPLACLKP